jgi:hypothetical protein
MPTTETAKTYASPTEIIGSVTKGMHVGPGFRFLSPDTGNVWRVVGVSLSWAIPQLTVRRENSIGRWDEDHDYTWPPAAFYGMKVLNPVCLLAPGDSWSNRSA